MVYNYPRSLEVFVKDFRDEIMITFYKCLYKCLLRIVFNKNVF